MPRQIKPLGITFGSIKGVLVKPIKLRLKSSGINNPLEQLIILRIVRYCSHSMVQQDIAELLGKNKSVIFRMVDALEREGLIRRISDIHDRRRNILEVTEEGNILIDRFYEMELKVSEELLKGVSDADADTFFKVIDQIRFNAEAF